MYRILVSDVFGRTPALSNICSDLSGETEIVDPYNGNSMGFKNESEAYTYFMNNIGLNKYCDTLAKNISKKTYPVTLVGFSVGASSVWQLSDRFSFETVLSAICFYGSQIRNLTTINPSIPVEIVLPKKEDHFSVRDLSKILSKKRNVIIHASEYLHGFMNPYSKNFNQSGYNKYLHWLYKSVV